MSLLIWYKGDGTLWKDQARSLAVTVDGDLVGAWDDASGNSNHAIYNSGGTPDTVFKTNQISGKPCVRWNGSNTQTLVFGTPVALGDYSAFFVVKQTGDNALFGKQGTTSDQLRIGEFANQIQTFDGSNNPTSSTLGILQGNWSFVEFIRSGSTVSFYQNGTAYGTGTQNGTRTFDTIGAFFSNLNMLNGDLAEITIFDAALGTTDRQTEEARLTAKYFGGGGGGSVGAPYYYREHIAGGVI